jgi:hypothetical protein
MNMASGTLLRRYRQWLEVGAFDAMLESLAEMFERDATADMIDSTIVRAHHDAVGIKRGTQQTAAPVAMPKAARSVSS